MSWSRTHAHTHTCKHPGRPQLPKSILKTCIHLRTDANVIQHESVTETRVHLCLCCVQEIKKDKNAKPGEAREELEEEDEEWLGIKRARDEEEGDEREEEKVQGSALVNDLSRARKGPKPKIASAKAKKSKLAPSKKKGSGKKKKWTL